MDIPGSNTDPTSALSAQPTSVFSDNVKDLLVKDLLSVGSLTKNLSAIITVNSTADVVDDSDGLRTLRSAINQACADNGEDLIVFDRSLFSTAQTITLSLGELDITHNLSIIAPRDSLTGGDLVTVSGNNTSRVFEIEKGAAVTLSGLIIADGNVKDDLGGGIKNSGTLTLDSSIVRNNSVITSNIIRGNGGGIYNDRGVLEVNNSTISGNSASGGGGGGIYNNVGTVDVSNSILSGNSARFSGGGINNDRGIVDVSNSTIIGNSLGLEYGDGGGIYSSGFSSLTVSNSIISNNSARNGGGIDNAGGGGTLDVSNSTISGNSARGAGGGISGGGTVSNSTISGNSADTGGGIYGTVDVSNSTVSNNSANVGGGIYGTVNVSNSTISGNSALGDGGGIYNNFGGGTVSNSTISSNSALGDGGGIFIAYTFGGEGTPRGITFNVSNSTISNNSARDGGGIYTRTNVTDVTALTLTVSNSTISSNSALGDGGGIYSSRTVRLLFSTLTGNQAANGGGVYNVNRGSASARNTIIAQNLSTVVGVNPDLSGSFTSFGYNLIGDGTGSTGFDATGDIVGTSDNPIDPRLAPLDFYDGTQMTIALLPDSPAIDAGDPTLLDTDPTTDQRGFPRVSGARADIGAFEFSA